MPKLTPARNSMTAIDPTSVDTRLQRSQKELADIKFALDESAIVAITDQRGIINYVNNKFCEISKYSREELLGQAPGALDQRQRDTVVGDDRETEAFERPAERRGKGGGIARLVGEAEGRDLGGGGV